MGPLKKLYNWMSKQVHSPYAVPMLAVLFFVEAIFFVPVDPILILYCIENRTKSFYYATIATLSSVAGGFAGYCIGYAIWESIGAVLINFVCSAQQFAHIINQFKLYESWAVLITGFTPLPYKAITLSAGFCKLPLLPFLVCSLLARGARFFLVAGIIYRWGAQIKEYIDRYFNLFVLLFTALLIISLWLIM